jgi:tellurite resistance protein TehA-like permease
MLVGTLASAVAKTQPPEHAVVILVAGITYQGLGFFIANMLYALYFGRLLTSVSPQDMNRLPSVTDPYSTGLANRCK